MNRRRAHLFLSGLDYYKTNPPGNVKSSENNQHFDMTCGGFVICFIVKRLDNNCKIKLEKENREMYDVLDKKHSEDAVVLPKFSNHSLRHFHSHLL